MKRQMLVGVVLIGIGVLLLVYELIAKTRGVETTKTDPMEMTGERNVVLVLVPLSSVVGTVSLAAGIFVLVLGSRKEEPRGR